MGRLTSSLTVGTVMFGTEFMSTPEQDGRPVRFLTEKGPSFATHYADGTWAMVNQVGNIQLNFYIERPQLPTVVHFQIDDQGVPIGAGPSKLEGVDLENLCIVRDYQSAIVLTLPAARHVAAVLANFIGMAENVVNGAPK